MDACRKHKTLVTETTDSITHSTTSVICICTLTWVPLAPKSQEGNREDSDGPLHMQCAT